MCRTAQSIGTDRQRAGDLLPGPDLYFDPLEYPLGALQRYTTFSVESWKALQIQGFFNGILQYFHLRVKFKSLLPRQQKVLESQWFQDFLLAFLVRVSLIFSLIRDPKCL